MLVLVTYDIPNTKRRTKLATFLEGYGRRVQKSVFECFLSLEEMAQLHRHVQTKVHPAEDNIRFYWINAQSLPRTLTIGSNQPEIPTELYVF